MVRYTATVLTWFTARAEREAAAAASSKQSARQAELTSRSRETFDAAEQLSFTAGRELARATLHQQGLALALAAYADVPASYSTASVLATLPPGAPRFVTDAAALVEQQSTDVATLRRLHAELLDVVERPARLMASARQLPWVRSLRVVVGLVLVAALGPGVLTWMRAPRNLARHAEWKTSSSPWREVARQPAAFSTWEPRFTTTTARYVRLRTDRTTTLHLERVEVHP